MAEITKSKLAAALGVSKARISQLIKAGLPVLPSGLVDRKAAIAWFKAHKTNCGMKPGPAPKNQNSSHSSDLLQARARKEAALAEMRELEVAERRGELLPKAEVRQIWSEAMTSFRSQALLLPSVLAPEVAPLQSARECQEVIMQHIRRLLTGLTEYRPTKEKK